MKILVTGATGFVGGHLVKRLLREQHEIHVLTRPSTDLSMLGDDLDQLVSHPHHGSIQNMIDLVGEAQPDAASPLFHSPKMVLVDAQGSIRGYFDGMSEEGNANIGAALRMLFRQ